MLYSLWDNKMFKLSKMTDYAIVCLGILSNQSDKYLTASDVSRISGLNLSTVQKILKLLASKSDLIETMRGSNGGYKISRVAERVYIIEVIEALEGPISITACIEGTSQACQSSNMCILEGNWNKVNEMIRNCFKKLSLFDLLYPNDFFKVYKNKKEVKKNLAV